MVKASYASHWRDVVQMIRALLGGSESILRQHTALLCVMRPDSNYMVKSYDFQVFRW